MFQVGTDGDFGGEEGSRRKSRREQHEQEKRHEQESRRNKQEQERKEKEEKEEQEKKERHSHERKGRKEKKGEGRGSFPLQYTRWQDQIVPKLSDQWIVCFKQLPEQLIQVF